MALFGKTSEEMVWNYLFKQIGNEYGVAGLMGNLYAESGLRPNNLQNSTEKRIGHTDASYTAAVDNGNYTQFVTDCVGYGLAQWTSAGRKQNLFNYIKSHGKSIGDMEGQLEFLIEEMRTGYKKVWNTLKSAVSIKEASDSVLTGYERPKDQSTEMKQKPASAGFLRYFLVCASGLERF